MGSLVSISGGAITQNMFLTLAAEARVRATAALGIVLIASQAGSSADKLNRIPLTGADPVDNCRRAAGWTGRE